MSAAREAREAMTERASLRPTPELCDELERLDGKPGRDEAERLARSVLIGALCQKHPEARRAFDAWADGRDMDVRHAVPAITAAARAAASKEATS